MKEATVQRYEREHGEYQADASRKELLNELKEIKKQLEMLNGSLGYLIELKIAERDR